MKRSDLVFLFVMGLVAALAVAWFERAPGYMDAEYYYTGSVALAEGHGFEEGFLWNYLDDPVGIPHPSHTYWMPLASMVGMLGAWMGGTSDFTAVQAPFVLLYGLVPVITASLAFRLNRKRQAGWLAGFLAVFSGFYLVYAATTDTFILYLLLGGTFFLVADGALRAGLPARPLVWAVLGIVGGLMHLARADGLLWPGLAGIALLIHGRGWRRKDLAISVGAVLGGYLLVMVPWLAHNLLNSGMLLAPGGSRALWLRSYDEMYSYPAGILTLEHWVSGGIGPVIAARIAALGAEMKTALGVQAEIFLLPLILAGGWKLRNHPLTRLGAAGWGFTLMAMALLFPFAGSRGGFLHSGAAIQPLWWALVPAGLEAFVAWGSRRRGWKIPQAIQVFSGGIIALALLFSALVGYTLVIGQNPDQPLWNASWLVAQSIDRELDALGAGKKDVVMINNPPGLYAASRRPSIVIPNGDLQTSLAAARKYGARWLVLESNHPAGLEDVYRHPENQPSLQLENRFGNTLIFRIAND